MTSALSADAFLCVCLNPVIQKTLVFDSVRKGEVNRSPEHRVDASGKGVNVARVLTQAGRKAIHLTQAGGPTREWFLALCAEDGLDVRWVESDSDIRFCYTIIDREGGAATELVEEARPVDPGTGARILDAYDGLLDSCRAVIVSGTKAAGFGGDLVPELARRAKAAGKLVLLDIKGADLLASLSARPTVVKPNLAELLATWPLRGEGMDGIEELEPAENAKASAKASGREEALRAHVAAIGKELHARYGASLVVTRGARPTWFQDDGILAEQPVEACRPLNPTGSGDAFTAGLAEVLAEGGSLREAVREGSRLGGLNAGLLRPGSIR
jgi:fructose-1-phosphate kinase PfkB-like protein